MGLDKNKTYTVKPYESFLYKWSPQTHMDDAVNVGRNNEFCNAVAFKTGKDLIVTYMQKKDNSGDAYVACGYCE